MILLNGLESRRRGRRSWRRMGRSGMSVARDGDYMSASLRGDIREVNSRPWASRASSSRCLGDLGDHPSQPRIGVDVSLGVDCQASRKKKIRKDRTLYMVSP
jgi:hypothetical protein